MNKTTINIPVTIETETDGDWYARFDFEHGGKSFSFSLSDGWAECSFDKVGRHGYISAMITTESEVIINVDQEKIYGVVEVDKLKEMLVAHQTIKNLRGLLK